ncbi:U1 small nuclear ribonucleoprotein C-like [Nicotiana tabacum]|uniref:U1 small nuclear ribonucleoprotein C n=2 Tax=Nicotiana TaxID=4085 RepID=A0A1S4DDI8_TOBAC|nr:PREDICTED: U1 small nuclear ribonucleoprotein C-like [Nicotiana sylvestris]XP_016511492.1 PREDICTED: U1 small nuclear ribonucleoprotein C-like [Nicotiana tabacum]
MPRYYCDYCDTYLTHDSPSVRKQHNAGYKHKANVRSYYLKFEEEQTQILIDQKIKERLGQAAAYQQIGAAYNQHLAAFPGQRPRLPMIPPPMLPVPGAMPPQLVPGARPPILPIPVPGPPGYSVVPPTAPIAGQVLPVSSLPMQPSSLLAPPALNPLAGVPGGAAPPTSSSAPVHATQSMYQPNPNGIAAPSMNATTTS